MNGKHGKLIIALLSTAAIGGACIFGSGSEPATQPGSGGPGPAPGPKPDPAPVPTPAAAAPRMPRIAPSGPVGDVAARGIDWLIAAQNDDGSWGEDKKTAGDVATTSLSVLALMRAGHGVDRGEHAKAVRRGIEYIRASVAASPDGGLAIKTRQGTQPQRKLGPFVDTFLGALVLGKAAGETSDPVQAKAYSEALGRCIAKIEAGQKAEGHWNDGGWAPVLSTTMAQMCMENANEIEGKTGVRVDDRKIAAVAKYNEGLATGASTTGGAFDAEAGAGVQLYAVASSARGQLGKVAAKQAEAGRDNDARAAEAEAKGKREDAEKIRALKAGEIAAATPASFTVAIDRMGEEQTLQGFGSMGGEEFVSYMMTSETLGKLGGEKWSKWNSGIKDRLAKLQNADGTWAGHHCITSKTFCTAAALMTLTAEREVAQ